MPIKTITAYQSGQQVFPTIQQAQQAEIQALFPGQLGDTKWSAEAIAKCVVEHAAEVVAILTCAPAPRKRRSDKGGTHKRNIQTTPPVP